MQLYDIIYDIMGCYVYTCSYQYLKVAMRLYVQQCMVVCVSVWVEDDSPCNGVLILINVSVFLHLGRRPWWYGACCYHWCGGGCCHGDPHPPHLSCLLHCTGLLEA